MVATGLGRAGSGHIQPPSSTSTEGVVYRELSVAVRCRDDKDKLKAMHEHPPPAKRSGSAESGSARSGNLMIWSLRPPRRVRLFQDNLLLSRSLPSHLPLRSPIYLSSFLFCIACNIAFRSTFLTQVLEI